MRITKCRLCGSTDFTVSDFRPKDFPTKFYFIDCKDCGASNGVVDIYNAVDAFRNRHSMGKKLATMLLEKNSAVEV